MREDEGAQPGDVGTAAVHRRTNRLVLALFVLLATAGTAFLVNGTRLRESPVSISSDLSVVLRPVPMRPPPTLPSLVEMSGRVDDGSPRQGQSIAPAAIDAELSKLATAAVAIAAPERARMGRQFVIEATLAPLLSERALKARLAEAGNVETTSLRVSGRMVATLAGGAAFDIHPGGPIAQWVSEQEPTSWQWIVTPKLSGEQILILTFDAIVTVDLKDDKRSVRTLKKHIDVEVGWPDTIGEWAELLKKSAQDLVFFWTALLLPIGAWTWAKVRRPHP